MALLACYDALMPEQRFDAVVIGAGPGGYPAAIRLGQLKVKTCIIEREYMGGVCLNVGCIPSKAVIHAAKMFDKLGHVDDIGITVASKPTLDMKKMQTWKTGVVNKLTGGVRTLLKGNGVEIVEGSATLGKPGPDGHRITVQTKTGPQTIIAKSVVLATGSRPTEIPGFKIDQQRIIDSTGALALEAVPARMIVIGGGYIGLELGIFFSKVGSEVIVVEMTAGILPGTESDCALVVARSLAKRGMKVRLGAKAVGYEKRGGALAVTIEVDGKKEVVEVDQILSTVGRRPNSENLGLESVGIKLDAKGFVPVDAQRRTSAPHVYAIGDLSGQPMLAHKASREGLVAAAAIAGDKSAAFDPVAIPAVIFTDPEVASVGLTEAQATERGFEPVTGRFPFAASGRAMTLNETDGFVKVVADKKSDVVLGVHMVGPDVSELIAEAGLALEMGATTEDLATTIHAHPTLPESLMEAAEAVHGVAIHLFQAKRTAAK